MFGRKIDTEVRQWIVGGKLEPEKVRPFLLEGEMLASGSDVVTARPMGTMMEGKVFSGDETVALLRDPNLAV